MVNPFNPGFTPNPFNLPQTLTDMGKTLGMGGSSSAAGQPMLDLGSLTVQGQQNPANFSSQWQKMLAANPQAAQYFSMGASPGLAPIQPT